jgi:hypothetical protein
MVAGALLQEALATPDRASLAVPLTVIEGVLRLMVCPLGGDCMVRVGGVLSSFIVTDVVEVFPALSVAVPDIT